ncbi:hypothetical protein HD806DRAFT_245588 [Xylariaceae sp. AK1471]|nr:hypothetical protein HD806DRAFT_245588 [Xylariaceae sp. AK1471]
MASENANGRQQARVRPPTSSSGAQTFDEILATLSAERKASTAQSQASAANINTISRASSGLSKLSLSRTSTALKKGLKSTKKFFTGPTKEERDAKAQAKALSAIAEGMSAIAKIERMIRLREQAVSSGHIDQESLRDLAKHEGVYLNPRPTRSSRFHGDDHELSPSVVARLSFRTEPDHSYVFLGMDRALWKGDHPLGKCTLRPVNERNESHFKDFQRQAQAYLQLCG